MRSKKLLVLVAALAAPFATPRSASADLGGFDYGPYYGQLQGGAAQARQQWWASLSPRQRQIVQLVDQVETNYQANYGQYIAATGQNAIAVANYIGAANGDVQFIYERLGFWVRYGATSNQADFWINYSRGLLAWH